jgi:hypothetical protein
MSSEKTDFGQRFFGSTDTFIYCDERFRPSWEPSQDYRLTAEHRHQLCVHLAAHAAISSLGGAFVYMLAVPGVGVHSWTIDERKSDVTEQIWARCSTSDFYCNYIEWDSDGQIYTANRAQWEKNLEQDYESRTSPRDPQQTVVGTFSKDDVSIDTFISEQRRQVRTHVCGYLAGHIADGITAGMSAAEALKLYDRRDTQRVGKSDIVVARGLAALLPPGEYENAIRVTEEALRRSEIWHAVIRVAEQLEQLGLIESDECEIDLDEWLPLDVEDWPPAPGTSGATNPA